jgi:hypothetical protein
MHKSIVLFALVMGIFVCAIQPLANAQDTKEAPKPPERQLIAYRLDFSINELAEGKKINSRHYSMNVASQNGSAFENLKIGSRVPITSEQGKFEYLDLGTSITVRMGSSFLGPTMGDPTGSTKGPMTIDVTAEVSSFADPEQAKRGNPVIRQVRLVGASPVIPDKLMLLGSAEDPDSNHEFQLTVLATKLMP